MSHVLPFSHPRKAEIIGPGRKRKIRRTSMTALELAMNREREAFKKDQAESAARRLARVLGAL